MLYLFDTNAVSDLMVEVPKVVARLNSIKTPHRVGMPAIVRGEILFGIERMPLGQRRAALHAKMQMAFGRLPCEPIAEPATGHYSVIKRDCQQRGVPVDENDLWIASCALALQATVVTRDSDLSRVTGLLIEDWTK